MTISGQNSTVSDDDWFQTPHVFLQCPFHPRILLLIIKNFYFFLRKWLLPNRVWPSESLFRGNNWFPQSQRIFRSLHSFLFVWIVVKLFHPSILFFRMLLCLPTSQSCSWRESSWSWLKNLKSSKYLENDHTRFLSMVSILDICLRITRALRNITV